jgi:hypothetical protein
MLTYADVCSGIALPQQLIRLLSHTLFSYSAVTARSSKRKGVVGGGREFSGSGDNRDENANKINLLNNGGVVMGEGGRGVEDSGGGMSRSGGGVEGGGAGIARAAALALIECIRGRVVKGHVAAKVRG